jgi:hypothetical protein
MAAGGWVLARRAGWWISFEEGYQGQDPGMETVGTMFRGYIECATPVETGVAHSRVMAN